MHAARCVCDEEVSGDVEGLPPQQPRAAACGPHAVYPSPVSDPARWAAHGCPCRLKHATSMLYKEGHARNPVAAVRQLRELDGLLRRWFDYSAQVGRGWGGGIQPRTCMHACCFSCATSQRGYEGSCPTRCCMQRHVVACPVKRGRGGKGGGARCGKDVCASGFEAGDATCVGG